MQEVTLRQIAKESSMSLAAVSLALRNSSKISAGKRQHIRETADRLGYRPDPLVAAGMARKRSAQPLSFKATLGWINDHLPGHERDEILWQAVKNRAEELGYAIDELKIADLRIEQPEMNVRKFCKIAHARGIHGVILGDLERAHHAQEDWPDMAVVVIGHVTGILHNTIIPTRGVQSRMHSVVVDAFSNVTLAYHQLKLRGYQKIGLTGTWFLNLMSDGMGRAAALEMNQSCPHEQQVPPYFSDKLGDAGYEAFAQWVRTYKPDVVLTMHYDAFNWLRQMNLRVPYDIGLAHIRLGPMEVGWSGIDPQEAQIGAAAVDMVTAHLMRNERGTPPYPKRTTIQGRWVDGNTTRHLP